MKATFYVQFKPEFSYGSLRSVRAVRMTQKSPQNIEGERVAVVKFIAELPDAAFEPFRVETEIPVSDVQIVTSTEAEES